MDMESFPGFYRHRHLTCDHILTREVPIASPQIDFSKSQSGCSQWPSDGISPMGGALSGRHIIA